MPQSSHDRTAELHNLPAHVHEAAATSHGKGDHLTPHEQTQQDHEQTKNQENQAHHAEKLEEPINDFNDYDHIISPLDPLDIGA